VSAASPTRQPRRATLCAVLSPLTVLVVWEICSRTGIVDARILTPPSLVLVRLVQMMLDGEIWPHVGYTLARFVIGTVIGVVPGIALGLTMGLFPWCRDLVQPLVTMLYPLPRIALFPLFLILVGLNETANILMIAIGPFFTMIIATMAGVLNIDPIYRDVATSFETGTKDLYWRVTLPAALPVIMSGMQISLGLALMSTTAVEYLNAEVGLGYLIWHAWQIMSLPLSLAALLAAGVIGALFYGAFQLLERKLVPWKAR
jgi:NitT/TauT family transport system permease protein